MISATLANQAREAERILSPFGISILDAAKQVAAKAAEDERRDTFKQRLDACLLANEERWSAIYADDMGRVHRWLPEWFLETPCVAIAKPMVLKALAEGRTIARSTLEHRARYVAAVLGHTERHHRDSLPEIMTEDEIERLFGACRSIDETRAVALLVLAGIRPSSEGGEITRLSWGDIGKAEIYIRPEVAKTGTDRHIPIKPRLRRMIKGHPRSGTVIPANWKRVWTRIRAEAGISGKQDVTRHTFASHYLAAYGEDATKAAMGHTAGSRVLFQHYRRAVTKADGLQFFR